MLELYHHGSSVCAAKVRFALAEKGLHYKAHYVDILAGDQFRPEYVKLNAKAVVPTLVHDGLVLVESTAICEYIDEVFAQAPLKPATAAGRHKMRLWTKKVDEQLHPACGPLTFAACHRHIIARMPKEEQERFLGATPRDSVSWVWRERKRRIIEQGFAEPGVASEVLLYDKCLADMEADLASSAWLAGDTFSLADVGVAPYVNRLDMLGLSLMWARRPGVTRWWTALTARPTFKPTFLEWCPPQLTSDLLTFGTESRPDVERILAEQA